MAPKKNATEETLDAAKPAVDETNIPAPPEYLSDEKKAAWKSRYAASLKQAQRDFPGAGRQQRNTALKAANALLAVPAPESAADIDKLEECDVADRKTVHIKGVPHRACVTADGNKFRFPLKPATQATAAS